MAPTAQQALPGPSSGGSGQDAPMTPPQQGQQSQGGGATQLIGLVRNIVSSSRMIGQMIPGAVPIVQQINDLAQKLQAQIIKSQQAPEPVAPPM